MTQAIQRLVLLAGATTLLALSGAQCVADQIVIESIDAVCGNGQVESGEQCDDGNTTAGDGCSDTCQQEPTSEICTDGLDNDADGLVDCDDPDCVGHVCGVCGNGLTDPGEECDDGNGVAGDGCAPDCTLETVGPETNCEDRVDNDGDGLMDCVDPDCENDPFCLCGNGLLDPAEACDDGNNTDGDGCSSSCQVELLMCGNGIAEVSEECDGGDLDGATCQTLGYSGGALSCDVFCLFDESGCTSFPLCGNGIAEAGEACDDGNSAWCDGCTPTCELSPTAETDCGNGVDEDCDGDIDCDDIDCTGAPGCP